MRIRMFHDFFCENPGVWKYLWMFLQKWFQPSGVRLYCNKPSMKLHLVVTSGILYVFKVIHRKFLARLKISFSLQLIENFVEKITCTSLYLIFMYNSTYLGLKVTFLSHDLLYYNFLSQFSYLKKSFLLSICYCQMKLMELFCLAFMISSWHCLSWNTR